MESMKACPFCGGPPMAIDPHDNEGAYGFHGMACEGCGARVDDETPELVARKWSHRTPDPDALQAAYRALTIGEWSVSRVSLYDEEGVDGWKWMGPGGEEYCEVGDWNEPPPVPAALMPTPPRASREERIG